jgi:hypothetical protein
MIRRILNRQGAKEKRQGKAGCLRRSEIREAKNFILGVLPWRLGALAVLLQL